MIKLFGHMVQKAVIRMFLMQKMVHLKILFLHLNVLLLKQKVNYLFGLIKLIECLIVAFPSARYKTIFQYPVDGICNCVGNFLKKPPT